MNTPVQTDWIGEVAKPQPKFKDIANTRDSVAERKASLCMEIGRVCSLIPPKLKTGGSIEAVRLWKKDREDCLKVAGDKRASVGQLEAALNAIQRHHQ